MAYVITEPCIDVKDKACVEVCPVDCIYEGPNQLFIHPDECIDCGACEPVCPVKAIFTEDETPEPSKQFIELRGGSPRAWPDPHRRGARQTRGTPGRTPWSSAKMPIQVSAEVPGECFPAPECTRLTSRTPRAPGGGWRRAPPRTDHMDRGNDALGEAPMVPLVRGTAAAGSGVRASVHRMVAQLGQSVGKVTIRPASPRPR